MSLKRNREEDDGKLIVYYEPNGVEPPKLRLLGRGGVVVERWIQTTVPRPFIAAEQRTETEHKEVFQIITGGVYRFFDFCFHGDLRQVIMIQSPYSYINGSPEVSFDGGQEVDCFDRKFIFEPYSFIRGLNAGDIIKVGPCEKRGLQDGDKVEIPPEAPSRAAARRSKRMINGINEPLRHPIFEKYEIHGVVGFSIEKLVDVEEK